ncbi:hypothetical protein Dvina_04145 [Dactylosporangium vinaceum]|uniref:Glycosyltransferase RgtA/B/C/D-like domain-containing protein n=1 Tax=Dactylosporangium vinaceum TaxID=53362 RepID=A0ABV5M0G6_9ACTN|nr:hypothetical protein [Dactylosporangium vinaceum]UAB97379.1 hypothetical protein Dvina_04145 [Dactylosporangium vinaceum]
MTRWLPALTVAAAVTVPLLLLKTDISDIAAYGAYAALAVVGPGVLIYRALRRSPHSLVEDLAFGTAVGLVVETAARPVFWAWPILAVILLRRHLRTPDYPQRPTIGWSWAVAGVALGFVGYLGWAFMRVNPPVPERGPVDYMIDQLNLLAVAGDLEHHATLAVPELGDEALPYHWFAYAHLAAAGRLTGIDLPVLWFRLDLPALAVLAVVLLAVAAWRVTGRAWAGPVAAALMYTVGETVLPGRAPAFFGSITVYYSWSSRSVLYASALSMPLIAVLAQILRQRSTARTWLLLALLAAGVAGAKSTVLPVALAGLVCAGPRRAWRAIAVLAGVMGLALVFLYGREGGGLTWKPFGIMADFARGRPLVIAAGLGAYAIAMGFRLAGALFVREWGPVERFLAGAALAGFAATVLIWHNSWGQHFFAIAGFPFGAILSAAGLRRVPPAGVAAAVGLAVVAWNFTIPPPRLAIYGVYGFAALVLVVALATRRAPAALVVVLFAGGAGLPYDAVHHANLGTAYHVRVTPDQAAGARWLRAHSTPDEYVATNVHRVGSGRQADQSLAYWISAYSERRVLLGSWGYSPESNAIQAAGGGVGPARRYWDPARLQANDLALYEPTPTRLRWLWDRRVRWILVDRAQGRESPRLADQTALVWSAGDIVLYRLTGPCR